MQRLYSQQRPIDPVTVSNEIERMGLSVDGGGIDYLRELLMSLVNPLFTHDHTQTVIDKSLMRQLITLCRKVMQSATNDSAPARDILAEAEAEIFNLSQNTVKGDFLHISAITEGVGEYIDVLHDNKGDTDTKDVLTGFSDLDDLTTGFKPADYVVLAGATSSGKTAFALSIARQVAKRNRGVGIFSLEMSDEQLVMRILSAEANLDSNLIRKGHLSRSDRTKIKNILPVMAEMPIYIDDSSSQNIHIMRSKARRLLRKDPNVALFIVDYLQLVRPVKNLSNR
jgi:replicative DNA helicase